MLKSDDPASRKETLKPYDIPIDRREQFTLAKRLVVSNLSSKSF